MDSDAGKLAVRGRKMTRADCFDSVVAFTVTTWEDEMKKESTE